jgi:hypothetical protein
VPARGSERRRTTRGRGRWCPSPAPTLASERRSRGHRGSPSASRSSPRSSCRRGRRRVEMPRHLIEVRHRRPWGSPPRGRPSRPPRCRRRRPTACRAVAADGQFPRAVLARRRSCRAFARAASLASGATASSRSKMIASAADRLGLLQRPLVGAGMYSTERRGRRSLISPSESVLQNPPRRVRGRGRRARGQLHDHLALLHEASSSILPSSMIAPVPSPIASITRWAWATSARPRAEHLAWRSRSAPGAGSRRRRSRAGTRCGTGLAGHGVLDVAERAVERQHAVHGARIDHAGDGVVPQVLLRRSCASPRSRRGRRRPRRVGATR